MNNYNNWVKEFGQAGLENIDDNELQDKFYKKLEFGTAGIRGKLGIGTNRINVPNVQLITQALTTQAKSVVIAYDVRHCSKEFAEHAARVFAANGAKVYLFSDIKTTPLLSFAVKELKTDLGIMITASHNPSDYNGYKVYNHKGSQILDNQAKEIKEIIESLNYQDIKTISLEQGIKSNLITLLNNDIEDLFHSKRLSHKISDDIDKDISIIFTGLNGTGTKPVKRILNDKGFQNVFLVEEQSQPDPNFPTTPSPNPENVEIFDLAIKLGKLKNADLLIATDPDCDRVGVMIKHNEEYIYLNGGQIGALLIDYIMSNKSFEKPVIAKSLVTSDLGKIIAENFGAKVVDTHVGFKYIYEVADLYEQKGWNFVFGYEESLGYTYKSLVGDKDAVIGAALIAEMTAYYKKRNISLKTRLEELFEKYGYFDEELISIKLEGQEGEVKINQIMESFRKGINIDGFEIEEIIDYSNDEIAKNVIQYNFTNGSKLIIRPSGTEPLIKFYINVKGKTRQEVKEHLSMLKEYIDKIDEVDKI